MKAAIGYIIYVIVLIIIGYSLGVAAAHACTPRKNIIEVSQLNAKDILKKLIMQERTEEKKNKPKLIVLPERN